MSTSGVVKCAADSCNFAAVVMDGDGKPWCGSPHVWTSDIDVQRNDPCPCGSGQKFKHCCLPAKRCFIRACRICGCTEAKACRIPMGDVGTRPCSWAGADLCTACTPLPLMPLGAYVERLTDEILAEQLARDGKALEPMDTTALRASIRRMLDNPIARAQAETQLKNLDFMPGTDDDDGDPP